MHIVLRRILYIPLYYTHVKTQVRNGKDSNQALEALLACQVFEEGVEGVPRLGISARFEAFMHDS